MKTPGLLFAIGALALFGGVALAGHTIVASTGPQGQANSGSVAVGISGDGQRALFLSTANNLAPTDTDFWQDAFVRDLATGAVTHVSVDPVGSPPPPTSYVAQAKISRDGSTVFFVTVGPGDLFVHDIASGVTTLLLDGGTDNAPFSLEGCSSDGRYVAFTSSVGGMVPQDPTPDQDAFVFDTATSTLTLVNTTAAGVTLAGPGYSLGISGDGHFAFFASAGAYIPGDAIGTDAFRKDLLTGAVIRAHPPLTSVSMFPWIRDVNEDGSLVLLDTNAAWVAADTNGAHDVYLSDLNSGTVELVSTTPAGVVGDAQSAGSAMSADGNWVVFGTAASNFTPGDPFVGWRVLLKDRSTQSVHVCSAPNNGGIANGQIYYVPYLSDDGRVVEFEADSSNLCIDSTTGFIDAFVHRVRGFFDLGFGVAGTSGVPVLAGTGTLAVATPMSVALSNTAPNTPSLFCVSITEFPVVTYGGTFVALPLAVSLVIPTDGSGAWSFTVPTPALPVSNLYMQCLIPDAAATAGVAMSNAIVGALF